MVVRWSDSTDKHGVAREDALHAMANAYYTESEFDEPRVPGHRRPTLYIGPSRQLGGPLLEIMVELVPPRDLLVFHVMIAQRKHLDRMKGVQP